MNNYYPTTDLDLASTLIAKNVPIEHIGKGTDNLIEVQFVHTHELDEILDLYRRRKLLVSPQLLFHARRHLKKTIKELFDN